ncbi:unnamed protein product [Allacma fusca]|uniref:Uncharacterized protein n=1 Tax=Allacma fusca TaxID=39272 RepID=A0A8J2PU55_9HEXA|nr:unnamed protein product [Allacma fusca]
MKMHGRFFTRLPLPGVLLGLMIVAVGAQEGQSTTSHPNEQTTLNSSNPNNTTLNSSNPNNTTLNSSNPSTTTLSSPSPNIISTSSPIPQNQTEDVKIDAGDILYEACRKRQGITCYGDKKNCIMLRTCTFVGAISENDTSINVTVLTRVYNPPYDGVNLTVELQRDNKGNGNSIICTKPRFKSFKIRLSWKNKTNYEPGNETQLATTIIDKDQLKNDCLNDQVKNNFTIPPSQTLALKFYIMNNNTLVSQGLTHIDVQESTPKPDVGSRSRTGKCLGDLCSSSDPPQPTKSPKQQQEDTLYEMCLKNTAQCFGDTLGCTNGHNCTVLGVIKENRTNYVVYLVTKSYDPPLSDLNVTLTLKAPYNINSTSNTSDNHAMKKDGCQSPDFKDLQVQSIWRAKDLSQPTNETVIREAVLDKNTLRNRCNNDVKNLTTNATEMGDIMEESINYYLHFHLENDTLVPGGISSDLETDMMDNQNGTIFIVGQNGTAYLVGENNGIVTPEGTSSSPNTSPSNNANASAHISYFTFITLIISAFAVLFSTVT